MNALRIVPGEPGIYLSTKSSLYAIFNNGEWCYIIQGCDSTRRRETYRPRPHVIVISLCHVRWKMAPGVGGILVPVTLGQFVGLICLTCTTAPGYFVIKIHKFGDCVD